MGELRKEERLFVELGKRRGSIGDATFAQASARAQKEGISVVEVLVALLPSDDADKIRKELVALSFTCPQCEGMDFRELDEPAIKGRRCAECAAKGPSRPATPAALPKPALAPPPKPPTAPIARAPAVATEKPSGRIAKPSGRLEKPTDPVARPSARLEKPSERLKPEAGAGAAPPRPVSARLPKPPSGSAGKTLVAPDTVGGAKTAGTVGEAATLGTMGDGKTMAEEPGSAAGRASARWSLEAVKAQATRPAAATEDIAEGYLLGGCRIEKRIGQGGMGRVYKGHHDGLDRDMAVKVIDERLVAKKGFVEQFFGEARTLAKLDHANVVRVFNVDTDTTGKHFIVMELLEGGSVEGLWRDHQKKLELDEAVRITKEAAAGLLHAHQAGLIHRDVKPGNLMLTKDGRVKVVDFGLAARTEGDVFVATEVAGTPAYMAPEQVDGLRLDARCDQYALGASLFQLLCGRPPFEAKRPYEILVAHMNQEPPRPTSVRSDLPEWVDAVILKMLAKAPADRFATLAEVIAALDAKDGAVEEVRARAPINSAEIIKLEKGLKPQPVAPPAWRPALGAIAACLVAAVLFIIVPARDAFGGADLSLGAVPGYVRQLEKKTREETRSGQAEDLDRAITTLQQAITDLGARAGAATLSQLQAELAAKKKTLAAAAEKDVSKRVADLIAQKKLAAAIELADPSSSTLAALGLQEKASAWRAPALAALERQGEAYVPAGPYRSGEAGVPAVLPGFYIDRTEVTNEQWAALLDKAGLERPTSWPKGPLPPALAKKPVTGIGFEEAQKFARAVKKRLPSSAEWEKAARGAADARAWPWGPRFEPGRANLLDGGAGALEAVGARAGDVSPFGVHDLAGNAMEWVAGESSALVAGGAFRSHALSARVFARFKLSGVSQDPAIGFRCARDVE